MLPVVLVLLVCAKINSKGGILLCARALAGLVMVVDNVFYKKSGKKIIFVFWLIFFFTQVYLMNSSAYLQRGSEVYQICDMTKGKEVILQRQLFISIFQLSR